ncbi:unnamed protein product [Closterium sp. Yama58-4]|nr:unnamed protein product [Closterium sp. Yama58-4]
MRRLRFSIPRHWESCVALSLIASLVGLVGLVGPANALVQVNNMQYGFLTDLRAAWGGNFIEARTWAYDARCLQGLDDGSDDIPVLKGLICSADGSVIEINLQHRSLVGSIPETIKYFTALTGLYLSDNELYGSLPAGISALASLQYLHLDYNSISGTIPSTIAKLPLLQSLRLKANLLTGTIPNMATLKNLATLDLSLNRLNGTIPPTLAAMPGLGELFLAGNSFTGPLPAKLNMPNLYTLDLSFNFLSGSIPATVSTLASLQYMDLGYNQFSGSLPSQMVKLTGLQRLDLLANAMTGSIPSVFSSLTALQTLVLQRNSMSGPIPPQLSLLTGLSELSVSSNLLNGTIPSALFTLSNLQVLELDDNDFSGSIPDPISTLSSPRCSSSPHPVKSLFRTPLPRPQRHLLHPPRLPHPFSHPSLPPPPRHCPSYSLPYPTPGPHNPRISLPPCLLPPLTPLPASSPPPPLALSLPPPPPTPHTSSLARNRLSGALPASLASITGLSYVSVLPLALPPTALFPLSLLPLSPPSSRYLPSFFPLFPVHAVQHALQTPSFIPSPLSVSLLDLSNNVLSGSVPASYVSLRTTSKWTLDVRSNMLVGEVDVLASGTAWYDNNYLSSTVFDASSCDASTPLNTVSFRRNCIPPTVCDAMPQRTDAECAAFCGLKPADGDVCGGQGTCVLLPQQAVQAGVCTCGSSLQNGEDPPPPLRVLNSERHHRRHHSHHRGQRVGRGTPSQPLRASSPTASASPAVAAPSPSPSFAFQSTPASGKSSGGLAFVIAATDTAATGDVTARAPTPARAASVAVEFDGFQDKAVTIKDMSANHVGLNLNGNPLSVSAVTSPLVAGDGKVKFAWIDYVPAGDAAGSLSVFVAATGVKPAKAVLSAALSLCSVLAPVEGRSPFSSDT